MICLRVVRGGVLSADVLAHQRTPSRQNESMSPPRRAWLPNCVHGPGLRAIGCYAAPQRARAQCR